MKTKNRRASAVVTTALTAFCCASAAAALKGDEDGLKMLLRLDESHEKAWGVTVTNAVNADFNGVSYGMTFGNPSEQGTCCGNFMSVDWGIHVTSLAQMEGLNGEPFKNANWTLVCYVRDPDVDRTEYENLVIATGVDANMGSPSPDLTPGTGSSWQVSLTKSGQIHLKCQNASGVVLDALGSKKVATKAGKWYQLAVVSSFDAATVTTTFRAYWTQVSRTAKASAPVATLVSDVELISAPNLILGGAKNGYGRDKGYFTGFMDEVSYWRRALSTDELAEQARGFVYSLDWDAIAALHWTLDEMGDLPEAADATGLGHAGTSFGKVKGGVGSLVGSTALGSTAYTGFEDANSFVMAERLNEKTTEFRTPSTYILWVRNPQFGDQPAVLARATQNGAGASGNVAWQVQVEKNGAFTLIAEDWSGSYARMSGEALEWERDRWYQVVLVTGWKLMKLYRTAGGATAVESSVLTWSWQGDESRGEFAEASNLVIGGGPSNGDDVEGGFWGGQIDDVIYVKSRLAEKAFGANLNRYWSPKPGFAIFIR